MSHGASPFALPEEAPDQLRPRRRHLLTKLVLVAAIGLFGATPWALHMGGRWTPLTTWDGFGPVYASNGGRYLLFAHLWGGVSGGFYRQNCGISGCDMLNGRAELCTRNGHIYDFAIRGNVMGWWTTNGARTRIALTGTPPTLPPARLVAFTGSWDGGLLRLASDDFAETFSPAGTYRPITSSVNSGRAGAALQHGTEAQFRQACQALQS